MVNNTESVTVGIVTVQITMTILNRHGIACLAELTRGEISGVPVNETIYFKEEADGSRYDCGIGGGTVPFFLEKLNWPSETTPVINGLVMTRPPAPYRVGDSAGGTYAYSDFDVIPSDDGWWVGGGLRVDQVVPEKQHISTTSSWVTSDNNAKTVVEWRDLVTGDVFLRSVTTYNNPDWENGQNTTWTLSRF